MTRPETRSTLPSRRSRSTTRLRTRRSTSSRRTRRTTPGRPSSSPLPRPARASSARSTAPTTNDNTASIGSAWRNTNATVTLTRNDNVGGSGARATHYTTDGSNPTTSSPEGTSITLSSDGVYTIKYFSLDNVDNAESVQTASTQIRIDKSDPVSATLAALPAAVRNGQTLTGSAADNAGGSGIDSVSYYYCAGSSCAPSTLIGTSSSGPGYSVTWNSQPVDGTYQVLARARDAAGNTLDSCKQTVTIDNTPPTTTTHVTPPNTTRKEQSLKGYAADNAGRSGY